mmetsp:Transcript_15706/g.23094  ORF Transcript_15706/g.23094 Transcript_15706/m.23094 type:complete len:658 (-) Transcript_15706:294-2267(-)|eukprot:CAMPEP_0195530016 /NCGR_PEP_ID=MMETSP0794_2-20130614/32712_1 /TAXON_ID=515487 /ORGANISM="Stephanopyxis turris, Strain CCMP 815" /LENGTH=657 /DNA_ID=CAMNT_0040661411 /DNA_START=14 /DNA_END=1987 /DNA_ORIENTATION=+
MSEQQGKFVERGDTQYPLANIENLHHHDVLCGRGGGTNNHVGNGHWRTLVQANKRLYISLPKRQKMFVAQSIVRAVRAQTPPGRFLQKDKSGKWYDIGDQKAQEKTSQALREGAPDLRDEMKEERKSYPRSLPSPTVISSDVRNGYVYCPTPNNATSGFFPNGNPAMMYPHPAFVYPVPMTVPSMGMMTYPPPMPYPAFPPNPAMQVYMPPMVPVHPMMVPSPSAFGSCSGANAQHVNTATNVTLKKTDAKDIASTSEPKSTKDDKKISENDENPTSSKVQNDNVPLKKHEIDDVETQKPSSATNDITAKKSREPEEKRDVITLVEGVASGSLSPSKGILQSPPEASIDHHSPSQLKKHDNFKGQSFSTAAPFKTSIEDNLITGDWDPEPTELKPAGASDNQHVLNSKPLKKNQKEIITVSKTPESKSNIPDVATISPVNTSQNIYPLPDDDAQNKDNVGSETLAPPCLINSTLNANNLIMSPPPPRKRHFSQNTSFAPPPFPESDFSMTENTLQRLMNDDSHQLISPNRKSLIDMSDDEDDGVHDSLSWEPLKQMLKSQNKSFYPPSGLPSLNREHSAAMTDFSVDDISLHSMSLSRAPSQSLTTLERNNTSGTMECVEPCFSRDVSFAMSETSLSRGVSLSDAPSNDTNLAEKRE